jgi:curved DNA-binding protein CbpA
MVKADATQDYYAALELPPGANETEIKKRYKELGNII